MTAKKLTGEVRAAVAELDDALTKIEAQPGNIAECHKHLTSAILHLGEATKKRGHESGDLQLLRTKVKRLNALFRSADSFYRGWSSLAAVGDDAGPRASVTLHG